MIDSGFNEFNDIECFVYLKYVIGIKKAISYICNKGFKLVFDFTSHRRLYSVWELHYCSVMNTFFFTYSPISETNTVSVV